MKPIVIHTKARGELDAAIAYYEKRRVGLGLELQDEVEQAVLAIQQNPQIGSPYKATEFRFYLVHRLSYVLYYVELEGALWIMAIAHGKRRPDYWKRRKAT